ncbi:hypothetical protein [Roseibium sp.]|uniref:hypothetical protein n=1 Tax=Roseibium sp. TaxID=1936156 RepID=UPI003B52CC6B
MQCAACHKPIDNSASDWMAYKRSKYGDWRFVCFHRDCCSNQSGWEKIEKARANSVAKREHIILGLKNLAEKNGITDGEEFVDMAAEALGVEDLFEVYP